MRNLSKLALAGTAALTLCPMLASAQFGDGLTQTAIAIRAYEASAERCFYEPIVGRALDRLREHYAETEPRRWERALRESKDVNDIVGNAIGLALQGSPYTVDPKISAGSQKPPAPADRNCVASGLSVGAALPFAGALIGLDRTLFSEAERLMEVKGRGLTTGTAPRTERIAPSSGPPNVAPSPEVKAQVAVVPMQASPEAVVRSFVDYGVTNREKVLVGTYTGGRPPPCVRCSPRGSSATGNGRGRPARICSTAASSAVCRRSRRRR